MNNLPSGLPKITAFKGQVFPLTLRFPEGHTLASPTALLKRSGVALPSGQQPTVLPSGHVLSVLLPVAFTSVAYNLVDLFVYDAGVALFGVKVETAERSGESVGADLTVTAPGDTIVEVTVSDLTLFTLYLTQVQEAASEAQTARDEALTLLQEAMATTQANVEAAAQSETNAGTHATNAGDSATASANSATASQTARTGAETARTGAEAARDVALNAVGSILTFIDQTDEYIEIGIGGNVEATLGVDENGYETLDITFPVIS